MLKSPTSLLLLFCAFFFVFSFFESRQGDQKVIYVPFKPLNTLWCLTQAVKRWGILYVCVCGVFAGVCAWKTERKKDKERWGWERESECYWTWKHSLWSLSTGCQIKQRRREKMICVCNWRTVEKRERKKHREEVDKDKDIESNLGRWVWIKKQKSHLREC